MWFSTRQDYIRQLEHHGLIVDEAGFVASDRLTELVYLDWLRRPQIGCEFARFLARPANRARIRTVVARGSSGVGDPGELAIQIDRLVKESVNNASDEALSVLVPQVLDNQALTYFVWELSKIRGWIVEREHPWSRRLVLIGLRVEIAADVVAETLGLGPFPIFPPTRQCPVTTLEIRTKSTRAKMSHVSNTHLAAHLADIEVSDILTSAEFKDLDTRTRCLRRRILEGQEDMRAKAGVTYSLPAAIWSSAKARDS